MGRILAIDYGTRRTGIAVTDPERIIASPLETLQTHDLMKFLVDYVRKEKVDLLVVGHPRQNDHSDSEPEKLIGYFITAVKKRLPEIPVERMDERFTSKIAMESMISGGMKRSGRRVKGNVDKVSAALILQSFLERQNNLRP